MFRKQLAALSLVVLTAVACSTTPASSLTVASLSPSPGASGVARSVVVAVVFDQALGEATLAAGFTLAAGANAVPGLASYDASARTARFTPTNPLASDTTYTATLSTAVRGTDGARLATPLTWTFTTLAVPAGVPATVTITTPTNGTITANPTPPYVVGDEVTFTATPASGFTHTDWGGACDAFDAGEDCVLTLPGNVTVSATFTALPTEAIVVVGSASVASVSGKGMSIDRPGGLAVGDLLLAHIAYADSGRTINPAQTGWVLIDTDGIPDTLTQFADYGIATQDDVDAIDQPFSWSVSAIPLTTGAAVALTHITNVDAANPVFGSAGATSAAAGTLITAPSVLAAPEGSLVLALYASTDGFVETADVHVADMTTAYAMIAGAVHLLGVHEFLTVEADTGARTATVATGGLPRIGLTIVLRPN